MPRGQQPKLCTRRAWDFLTCCTARISLSYPELSVQAEQHLSQSQPFARNLSIFYGRFRPFQPYLGQNSDKDQVGRMCRGDRTLSAIDAAFRFARLTPRRGGESNKRW